MEESRGRRSAIRVRFSTLRDMCGKAPDRTENQGVGSSILPWATSEFPTHSYGYAVGGTRRPPCDRRFEGSSTATRLDVGESWWRFAEGSQHRTAPARTLGVSHTASLQHPIDQSAHLEVHQRLPVSALRVERVPQTPSKVGPTFRVPFGASFTRFGGSKNFMLLGGCQLEPATAEISVSGSGPHRR